MKYTQYAEPGKNAEWLIVLVYVDNGWFVSLIYCVYITINTISMVPVNYLAVLAAAVASIILGSLWYGPIFGRQWMAMMGITPQSMEEAKKKGVGKLYVIAFIGSLLMAYVLSHFIVFARAYLGTSGLEAGLMSGFWGWLGFVAPVTLGSVLWEGKSWRLWFLNNGYYLILLLVMGAILAMW